MSKLPPPPFGAPPLPPPNWTQPVAPPPMVPPHMMPAPPLTAPPAPIAPPAPAPSFPPFQPPSNTTVGIPAPTFPAPPAPANTLAGWNNVIQNMYPGQIEQQPEEKPIDFEAIRKIMDEWYVVRAQQMKSESREKELRDKLVRLAYPFINWDAGAYMQNAGTKTLEFPTGHKLKATLNDNYNIENSDAMDAALARLPTDIQDALVEWKPEIKKSVYNALKPEHKKIISPFVTIKAGMPQVKLEGRDD